MKTTHHLILLAAALSAAAGLRASGTDATAWKTGGSWSDPEAWLYQTAGDGGSATISNTVSSFVQDAPGLSLGSLSLPGRTLPFTLSGSETLSFAGAASADMPNDAVPNARGTGSAAHAVLAAPVVVPAGASLALRGGLWWLFGQPVSGTGALRVEDGAAAFNAAAAPLFAGDVALAGGGLVAAASGVSTLPGTLSVERAGAFVAAAPGADLTLGALSRGEGGLLAVVGTGGARIGTDAFVRVADASTVPVRDGVADPTLVVVDASTARGPKMSFAAHDSERGFSPYVPTATLSGAGMSDIALVAADETLAADAAVRGVEIDGGSVLTVPSGVTLSVGDGEHPAAVLVNGAAGTSVQALSVEGSGSVDFGASEGMVCGVFGNQTSALTWNPRITGSAGVTFAAAAHPECFSATFVTPSGWTAGWTGPTRISGLRFQPKSNPFPAGGDVYVGDGNAVHSGQLRIQDANLAFDQHVHVRGSGVKGAAGLGVVHAIAKNATFDGTVTLDADSTFHGHNGTEVFTFSGPVDGEGGFVAYKGDFRFAGNTSWQGATSLLNASKMAFTGGTAFGAGPVFLAEGASASLSNGTATAVSLPQRIDARGALAFVDGVWSFDGSADLAALDARGVAFGVGTNLAVRTTSPLLDGETSFRATRADSVLTLGGDSDAAFAARLSDGAGTLSLVKDGAGTLRLSGPQSYAGSTTVRSGTLALVTDPLSDAGIAWRLDASDTASWSTDDAGRVTRWASCAGEPAVFAPSTASQGPTVGRTLNGLPVLSFTKANTTRLLADRELTQRTVLVVHVPRGCAELAGLFGKPNVNCGVRLYPATKWELRPTPSMARRVGDAIRLNGSADTTLEDGKPSILSFTLSTTDYASGIVPSYAPAIGRYYADCSFEGDIAEVVAYTRVLTDAERGAAERALAAKWGVELAETPSVAPPQVLPPSTALALEGDATLDLGGHDLVVASLAGQGAIANSSATPATLTVTGSCSFAGRVGSGVTLRAAGSGAGTVSAAVETGGAIAVDGGSVALSTYRFSPPAEGLALWLDASRPETVVTNAAGTVTQWRSLGGRLSGVVSGQGPKNTQQAGPFAYDLADGGGKPGLRFGPTNVLSAKACSPRCVFFVARTDGAPGQYQTPWGLWNADREFRMNAGRTALAKQWGTLALETATVDGASSLALSADRRYLFALRIPDGFVSTDTVGPLGAPGDGASGRGITIGANFNQGIPEWVNEVVVYEQDLSDADFALVHDYLMAKWIDAPDGELGGVADAAFATGASLAVGGGAAVDATAASPLALAALRSDGTGGIVAGDLTLDAFALDAGGASSILPIVVDGDLTIRPAAAATVEGHSALGRDSVHVALRATGAFAGDFASATFAEPSRGWSATRSAASWGVHCTFPTILIFL